MSIDRFIRDESGVTSTEYALLLIVTAGTAFIYMHNFSDAVSNVFNFVAGSFGA
ncbi:MAG: Flp family type IVb pilin [Myxococcota bacterium]